jgi:hypothetical protein
MDLKVHRNAKLGGINRGLDMTARMVVGISSTPSTTSAVGYAALAGSVDGRGALFAVETSERSMPRPDPYSYHLM